MEHNKTATWPQSLGRDDKLYSIENLDTNSVDYLVFASFDKRKNYVRSNGAWWPVSEDFFDEIDDPKYSIEFVDVDFIPQYDEAEIEYARNRITMVPPSQPIVAAKESSPAKKCPIATQDIGVNLKNRRKAISVGNYGPLDPSRESASFWGQKAELWSTSVEEAKKSTCANCAFFIVTSAMKSCIESGISEGEPDSQSAWDSVNAGDLGYCDAFNFKCASGRTCDAWVTGGPITDKNSSSEGGK